MKSYTYYDPIDGAIVATTQGWKDEDLARLYAVAEVQSSPTKQYYRAGELHDKREWEPVVSGKTITGLPNRCKVRVAGETHEVVGGAVQLDAPAELELKVFVSSAEYLDKWVTV